MDAREYLRQLEPLHASIVAQQERCRAKKLSLDMLRSAAGEKVSSSSDGKALENAIADYGEMLDCYVGDLLRWTALEKQAEEMFDRALEVLNDGGAHAITQMHLAMCRLHYMVPFHSYEQIRWLPDFKYNGVPLYAKSTVKWYCDCCCEWLDFSRGMDNRPLVPIVSE